jgi:hypothetical protein
MLAALGNRLYENSQHVALAMPYQIALSEVKLPRQQRQPSSAQPL